MATIMTVRAPDNLQKYLKDSAKSLGMTRNGLVLEILWEWQKKEVRSGKRTNNNPPT